MCLKAFKISVVAPLLIALLSCSHSNAQSRESNEVSCSKILSADPSTWHGFNLLNMFWKDWKDGPFQEQDFQFVHELGFNFVRLPLDYRILTDENDWLLIKETRLQQIDEAVAWGAKYQIHVCINLHRAPGYVVDDKEPENTDLWTNKNAQHAFLNLWKNFAQRYKGLPAAALSFNLLNEPANIDSASFENVIRPVIQAIREIDPNRPIIIDGLEWGKRPIPSLLDLPVVHATRGYSPNKLLSWTPKSGAPTPEWPMLNFNRQWLIDHEISPWQVIAQSGVPVFVGEFGARNLLPHDFVLAWMEDQLKLWQEAQWGWALWNLYGEHGIFDSERNDVIYENYKGHNLDRKMLNLLQKYK
jgi:endoglucanase